MALARTAMFPQPTAEPVRLLLVEDDPLAREAIAYQLANLGSIVTGSGSGEQALELLGRRAFDAVLLDVGLPGMSGFDTCAQIRARSDVPVIFLTAHGDLTERLRGFDVGGDDYVTKPMETAELDRRVRAVLRRRPAVPSRLDELFGPDAIVVRMRSHEAFVDERTLDLTPKEFELLRVLLEHRGEVLTADALSTAVWGYETFGSRNFVEAHLSRLRAKLRRAGAPDAIRTVRSVGYVIR